MSPMFDEFEDQLRAAARARVEGRRSPTGRIRGWLAAGGRAVPVVLAVSSAAVIAVAALVLLHGGSGRGNPAHRGGHPPALAQGAAREREFLTIQRATDSVIKSAVCRPAPRTGPRTIGGQPSRALRSELGVLRRPASAADRLSPSSLHGIPGAVYVEAIRRARVLDGVGYYIVPVSVNPQTDQQTVACLKAQLAAVRHAAQSLPASLRSPTVAFERRMVAARRKALHGPPVDEACLVTRWRGMSAESCDEITANAVRNLPTPQIQSAGRAAVLAAILPDRVASATLDFSSGQTSLTGRVVGNVLAVPLRGRRTGDGLSVTWRLADGHVLATGSTAGMHAVSCEKHPRRCASLFARSQVTETAGGSSPGHSR